MIREQNFSASSGGPFSCWLNSFSSRVRPAGETQLLSGNTGGSPGSDSRRRGRQTQLGYHRCQGFAVPREDSAGGPGYHTGKGSSGSLSHPPEYLPPPKRMGHVMGPTSSSI